MGGYTKAPTRHKFGLFDFGGGADETFTIRGPLGRRGYLVDYGVEGVIEAMNGDTTDPQISVGNDSDPDAYGEELTLSGADNSAMSVRSTCDTVGGAAQIEDYIVNPELPADTDIVLKCIAGTGSNLTGQGYPWADIIWAD
jgi:hypothetical protein